MKQRKNLQKTQHKPTIGVIMTGGTLAMEEKNGILVPAKNLQYLLSKANIEGIKDKLNLPTNLHADLMNIDSSNMNPRNWEDIAKEIERMQKMCDGILILHGTDTMAYTASALSQALAFRQHVPVVITGAQLPLIQTGSDAAGNLERSLLVLSQAIKDKTNETLIFFGDEAYRGSCATKVSESRLNAFESPSTASVYVFDAFGVVKNSQPRTKSHANESEKLYKEIAEESLAPVFSTEAQLIALNPGMTRATLEYYAKNPGCRALILRSFGAGNVPSPQEKKYQEFNLIPAVKSMQEHGIIVIITSPFKGGNTLQVYEGGKKATEAGAIDAGRMTDEAAITKTLLLLGQKEFSRKQFASNSETMNKFKKLFKSDFVGETGKLFPFVS